VTALLTEIGFNLTTPAGIFVMISAYTFAIVTFFWAAGLVQGNHSMMDGYYGFGFAIPAWIAYFTVGAQSQAAAVLLVMITLHGGRLGYYLAARWRRYVKVHGGDPRYLGFTKRYAPGYWWKSFFLVMEPQAVIIVLIGAPVVWGILSMAGPSWRFGWACAPGLLVFAIGLYFETVADAQLQAFLADKNNKGRYLQTGVWTHSRHPNYFGTTVVWWGMWLTAVGADPAIWWTVAGPVVNTIMLTKILGSAFQDKYMGTRPEYQKLMATTRPFLPIPPAKPRAPAAASQDGLRP